MAFTMQESGEWGITDDSVSPEPHREMSAVRTTTPVETLDSSESDFPIGTMEEQSRGVREEKDGIETLTRGDAAKLCVWSDGTTPSPTSSLGRGEMEVLRDRETVGDRGSEGGVEKEAGSLVEGDEEGQVEDVDATGFDPQEENVVAPITSRSGELIADLPDDPVHVEVIEVVDEKEEDLMNKTLTPAKDDSEATGRTENQPFLETNRFDTADNQSETNERTENQPMIEVNRSETPDKHFVRRGATYRKTRSSLSPVVNLEGGQQLEEAATDDDPVMPGDYTRRSGTFRKEKPSLSTTTIHIDIPDAKISSTAADTNTTDIGGRSAVEDTRNVSALQLESTIDYRDGDGDGNLEVVLATDQESGLKRSGTFRKEKPTLEVSPIVRRGSNASQHSDQDRNSDHDFQDVTRRTRSTEPATQSPIPIPTVSLTLPPNSVPIVAYPDSDDDSSVEESYLLVDEDPASLIGRGVRRSGTFTKERPNSTLFGDDYF